MLSLLKSDLYRLTHAKVLWVSLAILLAAVCVSVGMRWLAATPEYAQSQGAYNPDVSSLYSSEEPSQTPPVSSEGKPITLHERAFESRTFAYGMLSGPVVEFLAVLLSISIASSDLAGGFIKNVISARRKRVVYYAEKLVLMALVALFLLVFGIMVCEVSVALAGFHYNSVESWEQCVGWAGILWLMEVGFGFAAALVVWIMRGKMLNIIGVVVAFLVLNSALESVLIKALSLEPVKFWTLGSLEGGMVQGASTMFAVADAATNTSFALRSLIVFGLMSLVCAGVCLVVGKYRDIEKG